MRIFPIFGKWFGIRTRDTFLVLRIIRHFPPLSPTVAVCHTTIGNSDSGVTCITAKIEYDKNGGAEYQYVVDLANSSLISSYRSQAELIEVVMSQKVIEIESSCTITNAKISLRS